MTPTTGFATKEELYQVKYDLSKRISDVELNLSLQIGKVQVNVDELATKITRIEQNMMGMFAALFAHLGIDTPPLQ